MKKIFLFIGLSLIFAGCSKDRISEIAPSQVTPIVELQNGATYDLVAGFVEKRVGDEAYRMLAYNGSIPGPILKVSQGVEITLNLINETDVATTLHSHGVRLENEFDGVPDMTQKAVEPGDSFTYKIRFPDEGMYWYHPHVREDYAQEMGLYGNFWVTGDSGLWNPVNREIPLFVDDLLTGPDGIASFDDMVASHALMGRFGNVMLVNGETDYRLSAKEGEVIRFYVTNAANTRTFNLAIPGTRLKWVGSDSGRVERDQWQDSLLLGPSERGIAEVFFEKAGEYPLQHQASGKTYTLGMIAVQSEQAVPSYAEAFLNLNTYPDKVHEMDSVRKAALTAPLKELTLDLPPPSMGGSMGQGQHMMHGGTMMEDPMMGEDDSGPIEWEDTMAMMNAMSTSKTVSWKLVDGVTGQENMDIDWRFKVGDKVRIKIFNDPKSFHPMQHPIHFHGQRFVVLNRDGVTNSNLVWKDTVLVGKGETTEILLDVTNPGRWMTHCHIPEHMESGMMMSFVVEE